MKSESKFHEPALLKEAIQYLNIKAGEVYVDATIGGGGHSIQILKKGGRVFGMDCDSEAVDFARKRLAAFCQMTVCPLNAFKIIKANFAQLRQILKKNGISNPAGILFDLGTSLHQLQSEGRGFSFLRKEPLDMRMDKNLKVTAVDLIGGLGLRQLNELFNKLGEEKYSLAIARFIVSTRARQPIKTTEQLAKIAQQVYQKYRTRTKIHPATKIFQALRIAVNDEINNLKVALPQALGCLKDEGRLVVISFHGLEDRIVKQFFKKQAQNKTLRILTKKPVTPDWYQLQANPRARSAKLRAAEKL